MFDNQKPMQAPDPTFEVSNRAEESEMDHLVHRTEEFAREEPLKAVGIAFVAGLFMTILPIGALIGGLLRAALMLVRPALLILGAIKLYEEIDRRQNG
jgi:hypothetical protein